MTLTAPWIPLWAQPIPLTSVGSTEKWIKFLDPAPRQKESSTTPSNPVTRQKRSTTPLPIAHLLVQLHLSTLWTTPTKLKLSCLPTLVPSTICLKTPDKSSWRLKASQSYRTGKKIVSTKHCRLTATLPTLCQRLEERLVIWTGLGLFIPRLQVTINLPQKIDFVIQFQQLVVFLNQVVALRLSQKVVSTMQLDAFVEGFTKLRSVYLQNFTAARVPDVI